MTMKFFLEFRNLDWRNHARGTADIVVLWRPLCLFADRGSPSSTQSQIKIISPCRQDRWSIDGEYDQFSVTRNQHKITHSVGHDLFSFVRWHGTRSIWIGEFVCAGWDRFSNQSTISSATNALRKCFLASVQNVRMQMVMIRVNGWMELKCDHRAAVRRALEMAAVCLLLKMDKLGRWAVCSHVHFGPRLTWPRGMHANDQYLRYSCCNLKLSFNLTSLETKSCYEMENTRLSSMFTSKSISQDEQESLPFSLSQTREQPLWIEHSGSLERFPKHNGQRPPRMSQETLAPWKDVFSAGQKTNKLFKWENSLESLQSTSGLSSFSDSWRTWIVVYFPPNHSPFTPSFRQGCDLFAQSRILNILAYSWTTIARTHTLLILLQSHDDGDTYSMFFSGSKKNESKAIRSKRIACSVLHTELVQSCTGYIQRARQGTMLVNSGKLNTELCTLRQRVYILEKQCFTNTRLPFQIKVLLVHWSQTGERLLRGKQQQKLFRSKNFPQQKCMQFDFVRCSRPAFVVSTSALVGNHWPENILANGVYTHRTVHSLTHSLAHWRGACVHGRRGDDVLVYRCPLLSASCSCSYSCSGECWRVCSHFPCRAHASVPWTRTLYC